METTSQNSDPELEKLLYSLLTMHKLQERVAVITGASFQEANVRDTVYFIEWSHGLESWIGAMEWSIGVDSWSGTLE